MKVESGDGGLVAPTRLAALADFGLGVDVFVGVNVLVGVAVDVFVGEAVGDGVDVAVEVLVGVNVADGVWVGNGAHATLGKLAPQTATESAVVEPMLRAVVVGP